MSKFSTRTVGRKRILLTGVAAAVMVGAAALPAAADSEPTEKELMADCASGVGKCTFNDPVVDKAYLGNYHQVSDTLYNCSTSDATQGLNWSDSVGSTDTFEVSVTAGGKIAGIVDTSVTAKYGHSWQVNHTDGGSMGMTVKPGEVGWISRAQVMREVSGRWQTHYDNPHWSHYYWYWDDTITSPAPNDTDGVKNAVVVKTRPMTADEKASCTARNGKVFTSHTKVENPGPDTPRHGRGGSGPVAGDNGTPAVNEEKKGVA
ncbi:hypothetical protein SMD11_0849 [Streptomyces albireticuli]|uniref:Uncharacterized protein n=1 Tax=Streptomyces albireticuli TaxID=1940 RepID=A0A1Z2KWU4_9ACTN|nr:hypothetical protein [Streptomyces albireticuli]ARZ66515.1 hypothetical protein SMD11_0849 [Streptomyces albireticuli]